MNRKIVVAGAGHGGVVAAAKLAEKGYDVTVFEKKCRKDVGFDWHDTFRITCFADADIPLPPEENYSRSFSLAFTNPAKTVMITAPDTNDGTNCSMDRRYLINYLINYAESKGVKFCFNTQITGVIADKDRILGVVTAKGNKKKAVFADLVIDSAGINSDVRSMLPQKFSIPNDMPDNSVFTVYRAYFERISPENPANPYTVHLFHRKKPGISWVIAKNDYFDVLIGHFGKELNEDDIQAAIKDLKEEYHAIGDRIIRGGSVEQIPLGRTLPLIVADGYAAVGDSASMTIPIMGSGIANSIRAGKMLADAVIADTTGNFTCETLWKYQYNYFTKIGNNLVIADKLREICTQITAEDIDYALEKELLSQKDISLGAEAEFNIGYIIQKVIKALPKLPVITNAAITLSKYNTIKKILAEIPEEYNKEHIDEWLKKYNNI
ncbi:MAG: NAD(P)/FAD-dependent oxidoreductase [Clostridia bacterium]|nr:NAD(P)/FAD-dependent oxidoreductase [Clostridia bacterium]